MKKSDQGITTKGIAWIAILLLVVNIVLGVVLMRQSENAITEQIRARMLDISNSAAALLDGDSLEWIQAQDADTPEYREIMNTLGAFRDSIELAYIYCLRERPNATFEFTVDPTRDDPAEFGEDAHASDALRQAAAGTPSAEFDAYEDRWGSFYSAYSPVFNSAGKVAGIVGVDFTAEWYEHRVHQISFGVLANCIASAVMALLALLGATRHLRSEQRHKRSMAFAAQYDSLTGMPKMGYFFEIANKEHKRMLAAGEHPALLYMDLAGMKYYNQRYGFAEGDKLLKAYANLVVLYFGKDCSGRLGQDHFAVAASMEGLDARLQSFVSDAAKLCGGTSIPVRIGVYPDTMGVVEASTACDRAKAACDKDRNSYNSTISYYDEAMLTEQRQRRYVIENIDRAIAEGWIKVYYQPIVRASNGLVCDEEALARWLDPERGLLSPAQFIPALEEARLLHKLDLHVLEVTLEKMKTMGRKGLYVVPASVNLSRYDFVACDIVEEVRKRVDAAGIGRDMVSVEITESAIGRDYEFMKEQIARFHELGFKVWMDDFGSEYSSLDYLQSLHFDLMKLDMRFMRNFDRGDRSKIIVTEIVKMALSMGIDTIVEGVETREQVDFLREVGCSKLQGYYYTKPLPLEEVLARYENGTAIGFENPAESAYYSALGAVNLYDLSSFMREDENLIHYFDTLPMAIVESTADGIVLVRSNRSYRRLIGSELGSALGEMHGDASKRSMMPEDALTRAIIACGESGERLSVEEELPDGSTFSALVHRIGVNPVTGTAGIALALLTISDTD